MNKLYIWTMATLIWLGLPALAWADSNIGGHHGPGAMGYGNWHDGLHGMWFGPLLMLLFIAIATIVVVLIVRWLGGPGHGRQRYERSALDILEERFARGEIDLQEFQERRRILHE